MEFSSREFHAIPEASSYSEASESTFETGNYIYIPGIPRSVEYSPLIYTQRFPRGSEYSRMHNPNPNRLFLLMDPRSSADDGSSVIVPPPLPPWIWTLLVTTLGIGSKASQKKFCIATLLHVVTLTSAFVFGASGLFFNVLDTVSEYSKTTVLVSITKSVLGLYWIGLGIYANNLAARLFSNKRMVDCIRFHSKTFLKVSTAFIVILLSVLVVVVNLYSNLYLLEDQVLTNGTQNINYNCLANCASIRVNIILCKIYFMSKVVYSFFCLMWNVLIVGIFLSVCRTHTISIRRFMKELLYDTKIYVEFCRIQALEKQAEYLQSVSEGSREDQTDSDINIWDDDIVGFDRDIGDNIELPSNAPLLQTLRTIRRSTRDQLASGFGSFYQDQEMRDSTPFSPRKTEEEARESTSFTPWKAEEETLDNAPFTPWKAEEETLDNTPFTPWKNEEESESTEEPKESKDAVPITPFSLDETLIAQNTSPNQTEDVQEQASSRAEPSRKSASSTSEEIESKPKRNASNQREASKSALSELSAPIMSNEELLFIYFQLLRRFASTSRLLQRWISNWITFVMLWCAMLVVYWTSHTAQLSGIIQFLIPLVALGLLASGYAEFILPTEERMPVIYYFQNSKLELKIFSFTMTYNTIVTVVAGVAVTFGTRIILDQFNLGKGHLI